MQAGLESSEVIQDIDPYASFRFLQGAMDAGNGFDRCTGQRANWFSGHRAEALDPPRRARGRLNGTEAAAATPQRRADGGELRSDALPWHPASSAASRHGQGGTARRGRATPSLPTGRFLQGHQQGWQGILGITE